MFLHDDFHGDGFGFHLTAPKATGLGRWLHRCCILRGIRFRIAFELRRQRSCPLGQQQVEPKSVVIVAKKDDAAWFDFDLGE